MPPTGRLWNKPPNKPYRHWPLQLLLLLLLRRRRGRRASGEARGRLTDPAP